MKLENYYVSFIDILGFSEMVRYDCQSPPGKEKHLKKLMEVHELMTLVQSEYEELGLVQFSDSIVVSLPYDQNKFPEFLDIVIKIQTTLFASGILCRGGIALGKHFMKDRFLFSDGLIEAYRLESSVAKTPRIVISDELLQLLYPMGLNNVEIPLVRENDDVVFAHYLAKLSAVDAWDTICMLLDGTKKSSPSVKEKIRWLIEYYNSTFSENIIVKQQKFLRATMRVV